LKRALLPLWPLILWKPEPTCLSTAAQRHFLFSQPHTRQKPELPFSSHSPQNHFVLLTADPNSPIAGLHRLSPTDPNQNLHIHRQYHPSILSSPSQISLPFPPPSPSPFISFSQPTHRFSQTREPSRSPSTSAPSTNRPPAIALLQQHAHSCRPFLICQSCLPSSTSNDDLQPSQTNPDLHQPLPKYLKQRRRRRSPKN